MPPRTGPRRKRRPKAGAPAPRHFAVIRDTVTGETDLMVAHSVELDSGNLVFRDHAGAISHILAEGEWRDVHPASIGELTVDEQPADRLEDREQASLVNENDPMFQPTRIEEQDRRFVPSSPEEAQRILMELERRQRSPEGTAPDYQDESNAPPPPRKD